MINTVRRGLVALFVVLAVAVIASAADAQTVDMRSTAGSVLEWIAIALGTVLTTIVGVGIRLVMAKFGLANSQYEQNLSDRLNDIIHKGIDFALASAMNEVQKKGSGLEAVKFDNYFMSIAASYIAPRAGEILAKFKVNQEKLEEMIWARIPAYASVVPITGGAATPATTKEVGKATGGPASAAIPVVVQSQTDTPLPEQFDKPEKPTTTFRS